MPPEPLPWDRKDFFKERKHERSEFLGPARWRDSANHGSREFNRWGSADYRRPPGHGRQSGWHLFSDEYVHGYGPSMSFNNRMLENVNSRPSVSHGDGKYARNGRENRSFSQRDWKGHSWATSNGSTSNSGRLQHDLNYDQRSVHDMLIYPSHHHSELVNTRDKVKGQHDKISDANGLGTNQRRDREYSLSSSGWKPLKWTRSGGLSSRNSTSCHSSSTKGIDALDSKAKLEIVIKNVTQNLSPSGDPADCVMSAQPFDETSGRKKARLGWGEGLAKYEKKKVEVPDINIFSISNAESIHSLTSSLIDKGTRSSGFSDCTSPATPSSVVCGSSPGGDEKSSGKAASVDNDVSNLHGSPGSGSQNQYEGQSFNLEKLDNFLFAHLHSSLNQMLQPNDSVSADSSSISSTAINKLRMYRNEISEVLEMTESEIDSLENELKGLRSADRGCFSYPSTSDAVLMEDKFIEEHNESSTSGEAISEKMAISTGNLEEVHADIDGRLDATESVNMGENLPISGCNVEDDVVSGDGNVLMKSGAVKLESIFSDVDEFSDQGDSMFNVILASNKESARTASEALNRLLPDNEHKKDDIWSTNVLCSQNQSLIKERFAKRRLFLRFKERVITLKFRAFLSLWKENLYVPSVRRLRAKSQKKYQLSSWTNQGGYQKNRSSNRIRLHSPAGNLNPVPNMEILMHVSRQLSNSQIKPHRQVLKMPALILDQKDKIASMFISNNGLVEDPSAVERERMMINPWTSEEKDVYMDKLACFGKDFRKISSFLDHKTTADCVEFYYKNHKSDCFDKMKKLKFGKKAKSSTSTYLVTSGKKWNTGMNLASLDMLSAATVITARAHNNVGNQHKYYSWMGSSTEHCTNQVDNLSERNQSFDIIGNEREKVAADVLAGICGSLSPEVVGSCFTNNLDRRDGSRDLKFKKGSTTVLRWHVTDVPKNVLKNVDDDICSDESCGEMDPSYWTDGEKSRLIEAVSTYGKNFSMISTYVGTKSLDQCKVFFSKARKCLGLDLICTRNSTLPGNDNDTRDRHGGGNGEASGDPKVACTLESGDQMIEDSDLVETKIQELQENSPSSKIDHANTFADALVSAACNRKDSPHLASDDRHFEYSAIDTNGSVLNQPPEIVSMDVEPAREHVISAPLAASAGNEEIDHCQPRLDELATSKGSDNVTNGQEERSNLDASNQTGKAHSAATDSSALVRNAVEFDSLNSISVISSPQEEQRCYPVKVHSRSLSDSEQSSRKGDMKLFGQILGHPMALQKSKSGTNEIGNRAQLHHKFKRRLKIKSHPNLGTAKLEDVPSRSYGIWDGNGIRTGLSSLPEPSILMAKYPSAYDRYSMSALEIQQQKLNGGTLNLEGSCGDAECRDQELPQDAVSKVQRNTVQKQEKQTIGGIIVGEIHSDVTDPFKLQQDNGEGGVGD